MDWEKQATDGGAFRMVCEGCALVGSGGLSIALVILFGFFDLVSWFRSEE